MIKKYLFSFCLLAFLLPASLNAQELFRMKKSVQSRLISFENESGAPGNGGKENNGAKGHATETIKAGATRILADYKGSGIIQRMWYTISERS